MIDRIFKKLFATVPLSSLIIIIIIIIIIIYLASILFTDYISALQTLNCWASSLCWWHPFCCPAKKWL
ncbi:MAG: hypothetical protein N7Q72_01660, partial [Spiroplasma sp. Tabriz.8]|nr:hypothetical protein [Spiroplasma sp. Tabriz.8]